MVAWSGLPRIVRRKPSSTFGRHAKPTLYPRFFQLVLYASSPGLYLMYVGAAFPVTVPGWNRLHWRPPGPAPRPEMPHMSSIVVVENVGVTGTKGNCTSHRRPALTVSVGVTRHESDA